MSINFPWSGNVCEAGVDEFLLAPGVSDGATWSIGKSGGICEAGVDELGSVKA